MADPLPRNSRAEENAEQIENALRRHDNGGLGGFQGIGRPPMQRPAPAQRPNPFVNPIPQGLGGAGRAERPAAQAPVNPAPRPNPFAPRPPDPERQNRVNNAAPLPMNARAANPPVQPARPAPHPAPRPQPTPAQEREERKKLGTWAAILLISLVLLRGAWRDTPANTLSQQEPTLIALAGTYESLQNTTQLLTGTITAVPVIAYPTSTAVPNECDVNDIRTAVTTSSTAAEGDVLLFAVQTDSIYCAAHPLRVAVWIERVNGQSHRNLAAAPLYRMDTGHLTIQAQITPDTDSAITFSELPFPLSQLGLPSGTYIIEGSVTVRDWDSGRTLFSETYAPVTVTIP